MNQIGIEGIELRLLLEALYLRYGYDFRSYAQASVERRVRGFLPSCACAGISELIPLLLRDEALFSRLVQTLSITVTEMFRDPFVYRALQEKVLPVLKTWPHLKVWHAGCASGEEVYSMAILLEEDGLYDRSLLYATDFNDEALAKAREGIYELDRMKGFTRSYQEAGGRNSFSDYYHASCEAVAIEARLKKNLTFANINLTTDGAFGEMHLIVCRNVLIYFDQDLQDRVLSLFAQSLVNGGFLCIGTKEDLQFSSVARNFVEVDREARIYKLVEAP
ncbi:MAG: CheR family methyltransferase [Spirochaetota bacterium]